MTSSSAIPPARGAYSAWFELVVVYGLIECALWARPLALRNRWALAAAVAIFLFIAIDVVHSGRPSLRRLGLGLPTTLGASLVLLITAVAAIFLIATARWAGGDVPVNGIWPTFGQWWAYGLWALIQEFILQSFFFTRCEDLFGGGAAVWMAATLFAAAHLPNPLLTTFTFIAALFFCEMFRRHRSIYPIAVAHALLGLTVALTMPDSLLHHMRVGIGYLRY
ncbi:MAG: CPBP family intramembrane glutamic endopeptidase [Terriglobales bacterium]